METERHMPTIQELIELPEPADAQISPDGTQVVFQREVEGDTDLLVLDLASGETRPLVAGDGRVGPDLGHNAGGDSAPRARRDDSDVAQRFRKGLHRIPHRRKEEGRKGHTQDHQAQRRDQQ